MPEKEHPKGQRARNLDNTSAGKKRKLSSGPSDANKRNKSQPNNKSNNTKFTRRDSQGVTKKPKTGAKKDSDTVRRQQTDSRKDDTPARDANEAPVAPPKKKKPKHLKRKLAEAESKNDEDTIRALQEQQQELDSIKQERASKWETLCKSLVGEDKWDQDKFDRLIQAGLNKKKLLEALGVVESAVKKNPREDKRKLISRKKKRDKK
eukprot:CAMPEP_0185035266 /NCGR_PEP_ID=MMETSP1103-20130426/26340_1 /TAXON_ID=36769 /ORGANISM="Paraphysomonas bandaiensis, Strain Caron Lab Isolate" /LENGTH=206 /DNA_ID=CAMNT_0027572271 /DNA_START=44 /DNA_END=661 /DNA_ORIENTATION=+